MNERTCGGLIGWQAEGDVICNVFRPRYAHFTGNVGNSEVFKTVDGSEIRLTSWYGKYPILYRVSYIPGGAGFRPSTVCPAMDQMSTCCFEWLLASRDSSVKSSSANSSSAKSSASSKSLVMVTKPETPFGGPWGNHQRISQHFYTVKFQRAATNAVSLLWPKECWLYSFLSIIPLGMCSRTMIDQSMKIYQKCSKSQLSHKS